MISIYIFPFEYNSYIQKNIKYNPQGIKKVIYKKLYEKSLSIYEKERTKSERYIYKNLLTFQKYFRFQNWKVITLNSKPVALIEYLIKTYTNEWETVLDFTMWSWTTAVACLNTNRNFIWFELDKWYREIANKRLENRK